MSNVDTLPAPNNVNFSQHSARLSWEPPVLLSEGHTLENVSTDPHIKGYFVYVSDIKLMSGDVKEIFTSKTHLLSISSIIMSCSFSVQAAAVNPAGIGQRSTKQTLNCEFYIRDIYSKIGPGKHAYVYVSRFMCIEVVITITTVKIASSPDQCSFSVAYK